MSPAKIIDIASSALRRAGVCVSDWLDPNHDVAFITLDGRAFLSITWTTARVRRRNLVSRVEQALYAYGLQLDGDPVNDTAALEWFSPARQRLDRGDRKNFAETGYGTLDPAGEDYIVEDGPREDAADRAAIDEDRWALR